MKTYYLIVFSSIYILMNFNNYLIALCGYINNICLINNINYYLLSIK